MSCINITACQPCLNSATRSQAVLLNKTSTWFPGSAATKHVKISLKQTSVAAKQQQLAPVCLFGDKGKNENEGSPWKSLEKAMGNLKPKGSVEDLLKQQIEKQEYYDDGGSGGKIPGDGDGGGGGGGGDGSGESEDGGFMSMLDDIVQFTLATIGIVCLYIYILDGQYLTRLTKDFIKYLFGAPKSQRLKRVMYQLKKAMRKRPKRNPYWLERAILRTKTWYDSPVKYRRFKAFLEST